MRNHDRFTVALCRYFFCQKIQAAFVKDGENRRGEPVAVVADGVEVADAFLNRPFVCRADVCPKGGEKEPHIAVGNGDVVYQEYVVFYFFFQDAAFESRISAVVFVVARQPISVFPVFGKEAEEVFVFVL